MRLTYLRLAILYLVCLAGCSADTSRPRNDEADGSEPDDPSPVPEGSVQDASGGMDAALDAALRDAGRDAGGPRYLLPDGAACVALGCDELGYECGLTVDNCGDPLNCNLEDNKSPCAAPTRCGGDPDLGAQRCGCKPRANACAAQAAQCGVVDECGVTVDCGSCTNGSICLDNSCACTPLSDPCGAKVCGTAEDGCGKQVACGPSQGACSVGSCDATGKCGCPASADVCVGKTGAVMESGCAYDCGGGGGTTCVPDDVAACAGAECGTARNNCGDTINCGALAGACAAGSRCIGPQYVLDSLLPAQTGVYAGGYCVPEGIAKLLGKYATRTHAFRQAGTASINFINRAETVSLATIQYTRATGLARLSDQGCVATTIGDPAELSGGGTRSISPRYRSLPPAVVDLTVSGAQFLRPDPPHPVLGFGLPAGFAPGMPSYCVGLEGQDVDLPAGDPRRGKWWPDNRCTCPTAPGGLPGRPGQVDGNNYSTAVLRDCRIVDDDGDNKAGFTVKASALGIINSEVYSAVIAHGMWLGEVRDDRYHVGSYSEAVPMVQRAVLGCLAAGGACASPAVDCGCSDSWSTVQFVPLPDSAQLDCNAYYNSAGAANESVNQTAIDAQFSVGFGSCSGPGQCPAGTLCRANRCFSMTSKGACTAGNNNPCPAGTYCDSCPNDPASAEAETTCRSDASCWPTAAECPSQGSGVGGYCRATP
jgi:hypothetical protein